MRPADHPLLARSASKSGRAHQASRVTSGVGATAPVSSVCRSPIIAVRAASTSWVWIVSKLTCVALTNALSGRLGSWSHAAQQLPNAFLHKPWSAVRAVDDKSLVGSLHEFVELGGRALLGARDQAAKAFDHTGDTRVVFSAGLPVGVEIDHFLTAPSRTRNRLLGDALRSLGLAEREGTGVDPKNGGSSWPSITLHRGTA